MVAVGSLALVLIVFVLIMLWKVSAFQLSQSTGKTGRDVADAEETAQAGSMAAQSAAHVSNTAIIGSIALPAIFQISITFEMPFGFPSVLVQFAEWVTSIVSLDLGHVASPECALRDEDALDRSAIPLLIKFFLTVSPSTILPKPCQSDN